MTELVGPALARMRLSAQLRGLRGESPAAEVARAMHWSLSKLNRVENNKVTIQPLEVQALARHYGVDDAAEVDRLVELSVASRQRMWWRDEHFDENYTSDEDYTNFIALENDATHLHGYQSSFVPPLLQTVAYAEALTSAVIRRPVDDPVVRKLVDVRLRRQETFMARLAGDAPPRFSQVVDEAVLLRPVGGVDVMSAQLDHLLEMGARPTVQLVVIPLRYGAHPGLGGPFELLTFPEADDTAVVFIETPASDFLLTDEEKTSTFQAIIDELLLTDTAGDSLVQAAKKARRAIRP
jgi:Domain of unknown function (DUF5753)/Helix-turn-helix domain